MFPDLSIMNEGGTSIFYLCLIRPIYEQRKRSCTFYLTMKNTFKTVMRFGMFLFIWRTPRTTAYFMPILQYGTTRLATPHHASLQHNITYRNTTHYTTPLSTTTFLTPHSTVQDTAEQHNTTPHSTPYLFATRTTRHNTPQRGHITRTPHT